MKTNYFAGFAALAVAALPLSPVYADEPSWADRVDFSGDSRLRYEGIDEEGDEERNRFRFRARLGLNIDIQDDIDLIVRLSTGGDNPTSANQTIDDGFSGKDIRFDQAYIEWAANENITLRAGKIKNPLFRAGKAQLLWDNDVNPEGLAAIYSNGNFFGNAAVFVAEERSSADDSVVYAAQAGVKLPVMDTAKLTVGIGYLGYTETMGNDPFFNGNPRGNTVDIDGSYLFDYGVIEAFGQLDTEMSGWPMSIFAHYIQNNEVSSDDTGFAIGAKLGSAKGDGDMEFSWTYMDVERDATIGTFSDSNFGGGGTDSEGHILRGKYGLTDQVFFGGSLFVNDKDVSQAGGVDYNRIQIDLEFKFK